MTMGFKGLNLSFASFGEVQIIDVFFARPIHKNPK